MKKVVYTNFYERFDMRFDEMSDNKQPGLEELFMARPESIEQLID